MSDWLKSASVVALISLVLLAPSLQKRLAEEERAKAEQQKRMAEEAKALAEAARKHTEEAKTLAEAARKHAEDQKRKAEEERRQKEAELARAEAMAEEELSLALAEEAALNKLKAEYYAQIRGKIERFWRRPSGLPNNLKCLIRVEQLPSGEVTETRILKSSGNEIFDRSVVAAVKRASPMPRPKNASVFKRVFNLEFEPKG